LLRRKKKKKTEKENAPKSSGVLKAMALRTALRELERWLPKKTLDQKMGIPLQRKGKHHFNTKGGNKRTWSTSVNACYRNRPITGKIGREELFCFQKKKKKKKDGGFWGGSILTLKK